MPLQIASGKLFRYPVDRENHLNGVLYANIAPYFPFNIASPIGSISPTNSFYGHEGACQLIFNFKEKIEQKEDGPGILVSRGVDEYASEYSQIFGFFGKVLCSPDASTVSRLTSGMRSPHTRIELKRILNRWFENGIMLKPECVEFIDSMIHKLHLLNRKDYKAVMRSIRTFNAGIHRAWDDIDLSYTLFVASLESLALSSEQGSIEWHDIFREKRESFDRALQEIDEIKQQEIKSVVISYESRLSLNRIIRFVHDLLPDSYFKESAIGASARIGESELSGAIKVAYDYRSRYIHNLASLPHEISKPHGEYESTIVNRRRVFTFQGLTNFVREIIIEFINQAEKIESEPYNYVFEQPGVIQMPMAPRYWLWNIKDFHEESGRSRLEGFLGEAAAVMQNPEKNQFTDLTDLMAKIESESENWSKENRDPFLILYYLYQMIIHRENLPNKFLTISERHSSLLDLASQEGLIFFAVSGDLPHWSLKEYVEEHDLYYKSRHMKKSYRIPSLFEKVMSCQLLERFRREKGWSELDELLKFLVREFPGDERLVELARNFDREAEVDWQGILLKNA